MYYIFNTFYKRIFKEIKVRNPPFLSSNTRFEIKKIVEVKPGPGTYDPRENVRIKYTYFNC